MLSAVTSFGSGFSCGRPAGVQRKRWRSSVKLQSLSILVLHHCSNLCAGVLRKRSCCFVSSKNLPAFQLLWRKIARFNDCHSHKVEFLQKKAGICWENWIWCRSMDFTERKWSCSNSYLFFYQQTLEPAPGKLLPWATPPSLIIAGKSPSTWKSSSHIWPEGTSSEF